MVAIQYIKSKSISHGSTRSTSAIKYIVIHYTGNTTDKAVNNAKFFSASGGNQRYAGAHYFVDDTSIYRSINDNLIAWSVGDPGVGSMKNKVTNNNSISIELCSTNKVITEKTMKNAIDLVVNLMKKYKIPASNVVRHYDVTKKLCPGWSGWTGGISSKWKSFHKKVVKAYNESTKKTTTTTKTATSVIKEVSTTTKSTTSTKSTTTKKTTTKTNSAYYKQYTGKSTSLVDVLKAMKIDSSFKHRAKLAATNKVVSRAALYAGTARQNSIMLDLLKKGKLKKA